MELDGLVYTIWLLNVTQKEPITHFACFTNPYLINVHLLIYQYGVVSSKIELQEF